MLEIILPIALVFVFLVTLGLIGTWVYYIYNSRRLEKQAKKTYSRDDLIYKTSGEDYFEHRRKKRHWIELKKNRLYYHIDEAFLRPHKEQNINLNRIIRVKVVFHRIFVQTDDGRVYQIPTGFEYQDEILSALKYHRTRKRLSTR